jgi:hypothetical protein
MLWRFPYMVYNMAEKVVRETQAADPSEYNYPLNKGESFRTGEEVLSETTQSKKFQW